ncbi:hypothetical protein PUN28_016469 [Cardiocondyla obscurior]|uniref:Secreted protein n=1 Tax=Cardiocondyla obscurior TaxID=286306 RepID=A0AAW2ESN2_9HYME
MIFFFLCLLTRHLGEASSFSKVILECATHRQCPPPASPALLVRQLFPDCGTERRASFIICIERLPTPGPVASIISAHRSQSFFS